MPKFQISTIYVKINISKIKRRGAICFVFILEKFFSTLQLIFFSILYLNVQTIAEAISRDLNDQKFCNVGIPQLTLFMNFNSKSIMEKILNFYFPKYSTITKLPILSHLVP